MKREQELRHYLQRATRDRLGRFVEVKTLRSCGTEVCGVAPAGVEGVLDEHEAFLENLAVWLETDQATGAELADVARGVLDELREDRAEIELEAHRQALEASRDRGGEHRWVSGWLGEHIDLEQLDGPGRSRLALLLAAWNPAARAPFYEKRAEGGKRLTGWWRVDLDNRQLRSLGILDDLEAALGDQATAGEFDVERDAPARTELVDELEAELEARGAAGLV